MAAETTTAGTTAASDSTTADPSLTPQPSPTNPRPTPQPTAEFNGMTCPKYLDCGACTQEDAEDERREFWTTYQSGYSVVLKGKTCMWNPSGFSSGNKCEPRKWVMDNGELYGARSREPVLGLYLERQDIYYNWLQCSNPDPPAIKPCERAIDAVILLDGSKWVTHAEFELEKSFALQMASKLGLGSTVRYVIFSGNKDTIGVPADESILNYGRASVYMLTSRFPYTDLGLARAGKILAARTTQGKPLVVVLSLFGSGSVQQTYDQAEELKKQGIEVISIGLGEGMLNQQEQLKTVASSPEKAFYSPTFPGLFSQLSVVLEASCAGTHIANLAVLPGPSTGTSTSSIAILVFLVVAGVVAAVWNAKSNKTKTAGSLKQMLMDPVDIESCIKPTERS